LYIQGDAVSLSIRDPRVRELARDLAARRKSTMTEAIVVALEAELARERQTRPLRDRLADIAMKAKAMARRGGREMNKDDIDALWGQ
jgi:antitoxin VapB